MEIATREVKMTITIDYNDGCTKKIYILKYYAGNAKTPNFRWKMVEYIHPDGTIDEKRSNTYRGNMDEIDESETGYKEIEIEMLKTINYNDNSTKTIKIWKIYFHRFLDESYHKYKKVEFRNRNGTINNDRSYDSNPFNKSERKYILRILTNNPDGYDAYSSEYSKLLKKYDHYNGFQLCLPNDLRGTAAKKRPVASGSKINLSYFYTTSKVY